MLWLTAPCVMAHPSWLAAQTPHLHNNSAFAVTSFTSRKALLQRTWHTTQQATGCGCGHNIQRRRNGEVRGTVAAASAAVETPVKGNTRKRKQQSEPLLVVEGLSKTHDGQRYLFENVDFTVKRGDRLALVGPNGAGKSSLFRLLSGEACLSYLSTAFTIVYSLKFCFSLVQMKISRMLEQSKSARV